MTGHTEQLEGVLCCDGAPFEEIGDTELEPVHPDDVAQVVKNTAELPDLTLTFTPEQAEAVVAALKPAIEYIAQECRKIAKWAAEALKKFVATVCDIDKGVIEHLLHSANDNPRWWHLYKHAKKARTRKKYRRILMKQLLSKLKATAPAQEVNT